MNEHNQAPAGTAFAVPVWIEWQRPEPVHIVRLTISVSYDDGAHWQPVSVTARRGAWTAHLTHLGVAGGYVSLRAHATDSLGNAVEQTVIRAYALTRQ